MEGRQKEKSLYPNKMTKNEILRAPELFGKCYRKALLEEASPLSRTSANGPSLRARFFQEKAEGENTQKDRPCQRLPGNRIGAGYIH